jgi:histidinol-phosphate/aromatic aminotransferase/cobyric acid decarboxylase-like protein
MPFAWPEAEGATPGRGLLVLRSLTKLHAVPGLRLGFLLGEPGDIAAVEEHQAPWSVSAPAAAAGMAALELDDFCGESARRVAATRARLFDALEAAGFDVQPSLANFLLVTVGDARRFRAGMLERGYVVRDCGSFGMPDRVRIAIPHEAEADAVVAAMEEVRAWLAQES